MEREREPWKGPATEEFLHLDHKAMVWASGKITHSSEAQLAAEKSMEYLLNRYIAGNPPRHPYAWLKKAIDSLAMKWRQGKRGMRSLSEEDFQGVFSSVDTLHFQIVGKLGESPTLRKKRGQLVCDRRVKTLIPFWEKGEK